MTIAVDMGRKATKTNKQNKSCIFANSEYPDEMQHNTAFHHGLHCL